MKDKRIKKLEEDLLFESAISAMHTIMSMSDYEDKAYSSLKDKYKEFGFASSPDMEGKINSIEGETFKEFMMKTAPYFHTLISLSKLALSKKLHHKFDFHSRLCKQLFKVFQTGKKYGNIRMPFVENGRYLDIFVSDINRYFLVYSMLDGSYCVKMFVIRKEDKVPYLQQTKILRGE